MNPRAPRRAGIFCGASLQRFRPILNRRCRRNSERIIEPQLGQLDHIDCEGTVELSSAEPVGTTEFRVRHRVQISAPPREHAPCYAIFADGLAQPWKILWN